MRTCPSSVFGSYRPPAHLIFDSVTVCVVQRVCATCSCMYPSLRVNLFMYTFQRPPFCLEPLALKCPPPHLSVAQILCQRCCNFVAAGVCWTWEGKQVEVQRLEIMKKEEHSVTCTTGRESGTNAWWFGRVAQHLHPTAFCCEKHLPNQHETTSYRKETILRRHETFFEPAAAAATAARWLTAAAWSCFLAAASCFFISSCIIFLANTRK